MIAFALTALAFVVATLLGLCLVAALGRRGEKYVVLSPVVGIAFAVCVLHWQTLIMGVGTANWMMPGIAALIFVVALSRRRISFPVLGSGLLRALPAWVAGGIASLIALVPSFVAGTNRVIMPSGSHDGFYFVEVARWLMRSPGSVLPEMLRGPAADLNSPVFGPARATILTPLRFGQELFQGWLSSITGVDLVDSFTPWLATYAWFIGVGATFLLQAMRVSRILAALGGFATAASFPVLTQGLVQNADSLLGIALATSTIAMTVMIFGPPGDEGRAPLWLGSLFLAATVGTYVELVVFVGPALAVIVLLARWRDIPMRLARAAAMIILAVVAAPLAWFRGAQSLLYLENYSGQTTGHFTWGSALLTFLGSLRNLIDRPNEAGLAAGSGVPIISVLAVIVLVGVVAALFSRTIRPVAIGVVGGGGAMLALLVVRGSEYTFRRASDILIPIVVCVVIAGLSTILGPGRRGGVARRPIGVALVASGLIVSVSASVASFAVDVRAPWGHRVVDEDFTQAREWVGRYATATGANVGVTVPNFFDALWITDALAGLPDVSYPVLRGDLGYLYVQSFEDPGPDDATYLLIGDGVDAAVPERSILERNDRFELISLTNANGFAVTYPVSPTERWSFDVSTSASGIDVTASAGATLGIDVGNDVSQVELEVATTDARGGNVVAPTIATPGWSAEVSPSGTIIVSRDLISVTSAEIVFVGWPAQGTFFVEGVTVVK